MLLVCPFGWEYISIVNFWQQETSCFIVATRFRRKQFTSYVFKWLSAFSGVTY